MVKTNKKWRIFFQTLEREIQKQWVLPDESKIRPNLLNNRNNSHIEKCHKLKNRID